MEIVERVGPWTRDSALRPRTLERYVYSIKSLVRFGLRDVEEITREHVRVFLTARREQAITAQTCNRDLAAVLSFVGWLEQRGEFPLDRLLALRRLRMATPPVPPPRWLTKAEYARLSEGCFQFREILGLALDLAVHTGLRLGELRALHREDLVLDVPTPYVRVRRTEGRETKTGHERTPPISRAFAAELVAKGFASHQGPVFRCGGRGARTPYLALPTFERWLGRVREDVGMGSDVNWITCRHTYASWLVQAGVSIAKVARWMGHGVNVCFRHYAGLAPGGDADVELGFERLDRPV